MRSDIDDSVIRRPIFASALRFSQENLAISADQTLQEGGPGYIGFDPANTTRNVTLYTPAAPAGLAIYHKIFNYGTGSGQIVVKNPSAVVIATLDPGANAELVYLNGAWAAFTDLSGSGTSNANKSIISVYTKLIDLVNTNVIAVGVPFAGTLTSVGFRVRTPASTAAKAATLTGQISATPVTGGVISLTSANATPTNTLVAGTAITALNTFAAGGNIGVLISAVTAFAEGDGYVEFGVTRSAAP